MKKVVCVIPARIQSTRLPRKPLIDIVGKSMVQRTYERAIEVFNAEDVYIATESANIVDHVKSFGAKALLTTDMCLTGTDRVAEASLQIQADYFINLQGDEPIMPFKNIEQIKRTAEQSEEKILNGYAKIENIAEYYSTMIPKVIIDRNDNLIYMSRSAIPGNKAGEFIKSLKQICVYCFNREQLIFFNSFTEKSHNEEIEDIEILRFVDNGFDVKMIEMSPNTVAVDTIADHGRVELIIKNQGENLSEYDVG